MFVEKSSGFFKYQITTIIVVDRIVGSEYSFPVWMTRLLEFRWAYQFAGGVIITKSVNGY